MKTTLLLLFALALSGAGTSAQTLAIRPAVELEFATATDKGYRIESSADLTSWTSVLDVVPGPGTPTRHLVPAADSSRFFRVSEHGVRDVSALIETIRAANNVPAVACAVVLSNRIVGLGASGLRKAGITNAPVTLADKWHHGSLTKSMTATLAAKLVEQGRIRWDSTLAEVFPELSPGMDAAWRGVRLDWLCSNRGGATGDLNPSGIWAQIWNFGGAPRDGRRLLTQLLTALPPASTPGTQFEYSNAGFSIAGHMLETVANRPWEELITAELFVPLAMASAGFGVPATPRHIDQPWGHQWSAGRANPVEPGTQADNPPAIGPAGTVHSSVQDLARYVAFHLAGHRADTPLLTRASFLKLHTAVPNNAGYAYGWNVAARPWAGGDALNHAGSNLQWYSVLWLAPNREFGVVALCNVAASTGTNPGAVATDQIVGKMIQEFLTN